MRNRQLVHHGMTLVELLVVVAIIGLLLAVSVPLLRPVLDSRRTSNAAQVVTGAFQHARMKSLQEGKSYGIKVIPYQTAQTTAVQLRLQKNSPKWVNPPNIRVVVRDGVIIPCCFFQDATGKIEWQDHGNTPAEDAELESVKKLLIQGYAIQFNRVGRWFAIDTNYKLASPYHELNLPEDTTNTEEALEYCISSSPVTAWVPQTVMPRGTIVDLAFSGGETVGFGGEKKTAADIPAFLAEGDEVIVMFSPAGHVDLLYINGVPNKVNEMLYFCVGEWERQVDTDGNSLAEDKKTNLEVPATYWVTIHPKTGEVRMAENAPIKPANPALEQIKEARKFAREHFFNVGE